MTKATLKIKLGQESDKHDTKELKRGFDTIRGVSSVSVSGDNVAVDYDTSAVNQDMLIKAAEKLGFAVSSYEADINIL